MPDRAIPYRALFLTTALLVAGPAAYAQNLPDTATEQADPARAARQLPLESRAEMPAPPLVNTPPQAALSPPPEGADRITFVLTGLTLTGNTVLNENEIRSASAGLIGQTIPLTAIYELAGRLTKLYRDKGYVFSTVTVPPQDIAGGQVRLQAQEGRLGAITIDAPDGYDTKLLQKYADKIGDDKPLNIKKLERALLLANDLPGMTLRAVLTPSPTPNTTDLTLVAQEKRFDGYVAFDNYGSDYLGPYQIGGGININNWQDRHEQIAIRAGVAPHGTGKPELGYLGIAYTEPLGDYGTTVESTISYAVTEPGGDLRQFDVTGYSEYATIGLKHPFIRSRELNLNLFFGADARNAVTENDLDGGREDRIRALRTRLHMDGIDTLFGLGWNTADIELAKGLETLGSSKRGDPFLTRSDGRPDFWKLDAEAQRLQPLTASLNLLGGIKGQYAGSALLSSEEFAMGGMGDGYGRGYDPAEISGDDGLAAKLELQWDPHAHLPPVLTEHGNYQLYGFYDAGVTWNRDASDDALARRSLASTGGGVRVNLDSNINADFTAAVPLTREVAIEGDTAPRFYFALSRPF